MQNKIYTLWVDSQVGVICKYNWQRWSYYNKNIKDKIIIGL